MRLRVHAAALGGLVLLGLPAPAYAACMPKAMPRLDVSSTRVAAGDEIRVRGETVDRLNRDRDCVDESGDAVPATDDPTPSPSRTAAPLVPLPPLPPLELAAPARRLATVTIRPFDAEWHPGIDRVIARVAPAPPVHYDGPLYTHRLAATVTIPADVKTGRYDVIAGLDNGVVFGLATITVTGTLADTGTPAAGLTGVAVLTIVSGGLALELGRRRGSRA